MYKGIIRINEVSIGEEEIQAVEEVLRSGILSDKSGMGPRVTAFERAFSKYVDTKYAVAVSSGTSALHSALMASGVGQGDEVIVPSFTFVATAEAVMLTGAKPVFAEIEEDTYCLSPESVEDTITRNTKAIIPVDLYGHPADIDAIKDVVEGKDVVIIEDAAQSLGASYKERNVGSVSQITCFSFYASKNMTTGGEGGMVTTNDEYYAQLLKKIRSHGEERPYSVVTLGHNYRMTEIEAAIGFVQLNKLPSILEARKKNAETVTEALKDRESLALPTVMENVKHAWHLYTVRLRKANAARRNKIVQKLRSKRISAFVYYETPVHLFPYYREKFDYQRKMLETTERIARQVLSLPIHQNLTPEEIDYLIKSFKKIL